MLRFLNSLFSSPPQTSSGLDETLVDAAVKRLIDGTDRRLGAVGSYKKALRVPVERALRYFISLIDELPAPTEISAAAFSSDPKLRTFFVSTNHMHEVMCGFQYAYSYLKQPDATGTTDIFGLLSMERNERTVFGMELEGEMLRRDVKQMSVSFSHHHYICPQGNEIDMCWELKARSFDYLAERALQKIVTAKSKRTELESQYRLLKRKLEKMKAGGWGLESILSGAQPTDSHALETDIASIETELQKLGTSDKVLQRNLDYIVETLDEHKEVLDSREITLYLDHRGIKQDNPENKSATSLVLTEMFSSNGERRIVLPGRIPRDELPEKTRFMK